MTARFWPTPPSSVRAPRPLFALPSRWLGSRVTWVHGHSRAPATPPSGGTRTHKSCGDFEEFNHRTPEYAGSKARADVPQRQRPRKGPQRPTALRPFFRVRRSPGVLHRTIRYFLMAFFRGPGAGEAASVALLSARMT